MCVKKHLSISKKERKKIQQILNTGYLLFNIYYYPLFNIYYLSIIIYYLLSIIYLLSIKYLLFNIYYLINGRPLEL